MTTFEDLTPLTYFGDEHSNSLVAIGWLGQDAPFSRGEVPLEFFSRLSELVAQRFEPFVALGRHTCELCQFQGPGGSGNLFVPSAGQLLVCPELIVHYVAAHRYEPPARFLDAVMSCPGPQTIEYKKLFLASGGRSLVASAGLPPLGEDGPPASH